LIDFIVGDIANLVQQVILAFLIKVSQIRPVHSFIKDKLKAKRFQRSIRDQVLGGIGVVAGWRVNDVKG
jgi:hypothetical protein